MKKNVLLLVAAIIGFVVAVGLVILGSSGGAVVGYAFYEVAFEAGNPEAELIQRGIEIAFAVIFTFCAVISIGLSVVTLLIYLNVIKAARVKWLLILLGILFIVASNVPSGVLVLVANNQIKKAANTPAA